jgi:hypothetical protein
MRHYGIGELTAVTILAELGDVRCFGSSRRAVRYAGLDSPSRSPTSAALPVISPARGRRRSAGRSTRQPRSPGGRARPTATTTNRPANGSAATAPASRSPASCSNAPTTACANSGRKRSNPPDDHDARPSPRSADQPRPAP